MKRFIVPVVLVGCLIGAAMVMAEEGKMEKAKPAKAAPARYLVAVPHTEEECMGVLDDFDASKAMSKFDFGCKAGDHTAYAIVTAKTADDAKMMVPEKERDKAKVTELHKYTTAELKAIHASMQKQ